MKKKIAVCLIAFVLMIRMIIPSYAATQDTWGPNWYTPYTGLMKASSTEVKAESLYWSANSLSQYATLQAGTNWYLCIEFEFRPNTGHPIDYWYKPADSDFITNFPSGYKEFEDGTSASDNDTAVCCGRVVSCVTTKAYYGKLFLTEQSNASFNNTLQFESEYGIKMFGDALPSHYEIFQTAANFNTNYTW